MVGAWNVSKKKCGRESLPLSEPPFDSHSPSIFFPYRKNYHDYIDDGSNNAIFKTVYKTYDAFPMSITEMQGMIHFYFLQREDKHAD